MALWPSLILILVEWGVLNKSFMFTAVLDLKHPVLQKAVLLWFVAYHDGKLFSWYRLILRANCHCIGYMLSHRPNLKFVTTILMHLLLQLRCKEGSVWECSVLHIFTNICCSWPWLQKLMSSYRVNIIIIPIKYDLFIFIGLQQVNQSFQSRTLVKESKLMARFISLHYLHEDFIRQSKNLVGQMR